MSAMTAGGQSSLGVLLMAMPDAPSVLSRSMRLPNVTIASMAANVRGAETHLLDLAAEPQGIAEAIRTALLRYRPELVVLHAQTFQYGTAKEAAAIVRQRLPAAKIALCGPHATLAHQEIAADGGSHVFDYLIRGEGEGTLDDLIASRRKGIPQEPGIPGLSYRVGSTFKHSADAPLADLSSLRPPARSARLATRFTYYNRPFDSVETSRGCAPTCRHSQTNAIYGGRYRTFPISRVISDIRSAAALGVQGIYFADDCINLDVDRLESLCDEIFDAGLHTLDYVCQGDVAGFEHAPYLPQKMQRAGFRGVFLNIETFRPAAAEFLGRGTTFERALKVVSDLRNCRIGVCGMVTLGTPDESEGTISATFQAIHRLGLDHAIVRCLTPYPGTPARADLLAEGLVTNRANYSDYNGFICNVRTRFLESDRLAKAIATQALKLYFHPTFLLHGRTWGRFGHSVLPYYQSAAEYLTKGYSNRLFESRHRF